MNAEEMIHAADAKLSEGDPGAALDLLETATVKGEVDAHRHILMSICHFELRELDLAEYHFRRSLMILRRLEQTVTVIDMRARVHHLLACLLHHRGERVLASRERTESCALFLLLRHLKPPLVWREVVARPTLRQFSLN